MLDMALVIVVVDNVIVVVLDGVIVVVSVDKAVLAVVFICEPFTAKY